MGNFDEHFNAGKTVGLLAAVAGIFLVLDRGGSIGEAIIIAAGIGSILVIGSILPDIDHHASKPRQAAGNLGVLMVVGGAIGLVIFAPDIVARLGGIVNSLGISGSPIFLGIGVLIVVAIVLLTTGGDAFDSLTKHRGGTHSLPFVGLVGLVTLLASQKLANFGGIFGVLQGLNGVLLAAAAAGGVLVHLIVDS